MIRATKHDLLWFDGRKRRTKHVGDVFQADPRVEAQWVAEGVAEYVEADGPGDGDGAVVTIAPKVSVALEVTETVGGVTTTETVEAPDLADMTRAELAELAEEYGIRAGKKTKAQLVAAIEEAEQAPDLTAAEVE